MHFKSAGTRLEFMDFKNIIDRKLFSRGATLKENCSKQHLRTGVFDLILKKLIRIEFESAYIKKVDIYIFIDFSIGFLSRSKFEFLYFLFYNTTKTVFFKLFKFVISFLLSCCFFHKIFPDFRDLQHQSKHKTDEISSELFYNISYF